MQKVTKLLLVLLMLPLAFASAASNKKVSEKRMSAYLMVFIVTTRTVCIWH